MKHLDDRYWDDMALLLFFALFLRGTNFVYVCALQVFNCTWEHLYIN